jgi:hypothetical protein
MFFISNALYPGQKQTNKKSQDNLRYVPGEIVVKFKSQAPGLQKIESSNAFIQFVQKYNVVSSERVFKDVKNVSLVKDGMAGLSRVYLLKVPVPVDVLKIAAKMQQDSEIEYAEPHYLFPVNAIPNDSLYTRQEYLTQVKAPEAWDIVKGDTSIIIGIIDTGVDWDHPDLASQILRNWNEIPDNGIDDDGNGYIDDTRGWDFVTGVNGTTDYDAAQGEDGDKPDNNPMDFNGHGTHVSGIAGASTDNHIGVASLSWGCRILPLRCGWQGRNEVGYVSSVFSAQAYIYAADKGASIVNQSSGTSLVVLDGARYAYLNGVVIVNAAGNSNDETVGLLGTQPWAFSVASVEGNDVKASYSTFGTAIDISAPGGGFVNDIWSTFVNDSYTSLMGTSMASPVVAALAGLVKSQHPEWTPSQIMFQITGTADNVDDKNPAYAGKLGYGRINAFRAVTETPLLPQPKIEFAGFVADDAAGNNNGKIEPGETVHLVLSFTNSWGDAVNTQLKLSANHWAATLTQPISNYGTIPGISDLLNSTKSNASNPFEIVISSEAIPSIIPFTVTLTADNGYSRTFEFELAINPSILFVDDDHEGAAGVNVEIEGYYFNALKEIGVSYDHWDHAIKGTPTASIMQKYSMVIWACEWAFPSLDSLDRAELSNYLDAGGRLFLSGQDIGWDLNDPSDGYPNEFNLSLGASKIFYEKYLQAQYVADKASSSSLSGVEGDSVGEGLAFSIFQPDRPSQYQYPDAVTPIQDGESVFKYPDGQTGAVRHSGNSRVVYFAFGGFEAITDSSTRTIVMKRVLNYLNGYYLAFDPLKDTEDIVNGYALTANISSLSPIVSAALYYDTDGSFPFNKIPMTDNGNGSYSATIPTQNDKEIQYFILVKTVDGYFPFELKSFHAGTDQIPPTITVLNPIKNSISRQGPFTVNIRAIDNIGVDTTQAFAKFIATGSYDEHSVRLIKTAVENEFSGELFFESPLQVGDTVGYYFTVKDISSNHNQSNLPETGFMKFLIGQEVVDDFEDSLKSVSKWNPGESWNVAKTPSHSGGYSVKDNPGGNYKPNSVNILLLKEGFNLSGYRDATLKFWRRNIIDKSDTCFVDVSNDGTKWTALLSINGTKFGWIQESVLLTGFTGTGNNNVQIRFRMVSDGAVEKAGIYIDDIEVFAEGSVVAVEQKELNTTPITYSFSQNYPNPFNPTTTINYSIPTNSFVTLKVFNILGQEVALLVNETLAAGKYTVTFNAANLTSGVYFYRVEATPVREGAAALTGSFYSVKKMLLIR